MKRIRHKLGVADESLESFVCFLLYTFTTFVNLVMKTAISSQIAAHTLTTFLYIIRPKLEPKLCLILNLILLETVSGNSNTGPTKLTKGGEGASRVAVFNLYSNQKPIQGGPIKTVLL